MEKGISPLVAAVLLIAATMAIATVLTYWASTFVRVSLPPVANQTYGECLAADFDIYSCSKTNTTTEANISMILYNKYAVELRNITVFAFKADGTVNSSSPKPDNVLPGNTYKGFTATVAWPYNKIAITTHCPTVTKEHACQ